MKILFLDFDGVITTYESRWKIDESKVKLVNKIVLETDAKIVVTSSWKIGYRIVDEFKKEIINKYNNQEWIKPFVDNIYDLTDSKGEWRGDEIHRWLEDKEVESYVIIDDDSDFREDQLFNFVQTDSYEGITEREVKLCINILNGKKIINPIRLNLELITMWRNKCCGIVSDMEIDRLLQEYYNK